MDDSLFAPDVRIGMPEWYVIYSNKVTELPAYVLTVQLYIISKGFVAR